MGHLKRLAAPPHLKISVKEAVFTVCPSPGPHPKYECIPLLLIVRDYLKYAERAEEARKIIKAGKILVDGRPIKDYKFPVGLMDVISIPETGENFRILPIYRRGLDLVEIPEEESGFKLGKIIRKMHIPGGYIQITLHDGRNIRFEDVDEGRKLYTKDTLKISIPSQTILGHLKLEEGKYGLLIKGPKQGLHGKIIEIRKGVVYPAKPLVKLQTQQGEVISILDYVMVIGEEEPWIKLPQ
ncbi:MAG: 30S ribosomal protein S4e [Thaumarchaeota archaeon]|nr:MAG: 30S ribosomal protein S4e [Nitrososphaerota archaeon]